MQFIREIHDARRGKAPVISFEFFPPKTDEGDRNLLEKTIPALMTIDESFDVGIDTRTGVDDNDYQSPFRFTGKINKLTIKLVPPNATAQEEKLINQKTNEAKIAAQ